MKGKLAHLLRWLFALAFVGFGIYALTDLVTSLMKSKVDLFFLLMTSFLFFVLVLVPFGLGYLVFRWRYHELCSVLAVLGAILVFFFLMGLPRRLGWYHALRWLDDTPFMGLLGLLISLLFLIGPFYAAAWFHRMFIRLADRFLPASKPRRWAALDAGPQR